MPQSPTEAAARVSAEREDALFESVPLPVFILDPGSLQIRRVNEAAVRYSGYSRAELAALPPGGLCVPAEEAKYLAWLRQATADQDREVWSRVKKGGTVSRARGISFPVVFHGRRARLAAFIDVTHAEDTLRLQGAALDATANSILITDRNGRIQWVNPAFTALTGYSLDEVRDQTPRLLKSEFTDDATHTTLWSAITAGRVWSGEIVNRRKDGTTYRHALTVTPVRDAGGQIGHFVGISQDVTEYRHLEEQFRQAQKMEAIGQLTSGIAHDFNNILSVIVGNSELLEAGLAGNPELIGEVRDIATAAARGATMIRRLLGFSRHADLNVQPVPLRNLVTDALKMLRRLLPEDIDISTSVADSPKVVRVDPAAVEQMLLNLGTNARDAMPQGGAFRIAVQPLAPDVAFWRQHPDMPPGEYACLSAQDTGTGMTEETLARIFEPFFTTKAPGVGTGLGMPMVYGLAKQQRGFVHVESAPGQGTTVRLYFPIIAEQPADATAPPSSTARRARASATVLFVEDEDALRRTGQRLLERLGYRVFAAADGAEGLAVYRAHKHEIDLVISDIVMPKMSGPDLCAAIFDEGRPVPFLFSSGYGVQELAHRGVEGHAAGHLQKPWTLDEIARAVDRALGSAA